MNEIINESNENFIEAILPEISYTNSYINLNNSYQLDELLTYLERRLDLIQLDKSISCKLTVPSINLFRILLTLASRHPIINYSVHDTITGDSFFANDKHEDHDHFMFKPSLKERSVYIIRRYMDILFNSEPENLYPLNLLRTNLMQLILDLVEKPKIRSKGNLRNTTKPILEPIKSLVNNSNLSQLQEKRVDVVSDSDDDIVVLKPIRSTVEMEEEVKKYQTYNTHPVRINQMQGLNKVSEGNLHKSSPHILARNSRNPSPSPSERYPQHPLEAIRIFGDNITGYNLNKNLNTRYSFWDFLTWVFYCAKKSADEENHNMFSQYTSIFQTYYEVANVIIDLLIHSFHHECITNSGCNLTIENISSLKDLHSCKKHLRGFFKGFNDKSTLLKLLMQLDCREHDICDYTTNTLFNGLSNESFVTPFPLFDRDTQVVNRGISEDIVLLGGQTNSLTMGLRIKILQLLYMRTSLYEAIGSGDNFFTTNKLIQQIASNLLEIDIHYVKEFHVILYNECTIMSKDFRENMIFEICKAIISQLMNDTKRKHLHIIKDIALKTNEKALKYIIKMIKDKEMYLSIIEDETFLSIEDFEQAWYKLNHCIEWIFIFSLNKFQQEPLKNSQLEHLLLQATKADKTRKKLYKKFILEHYETREEGISFNLSLSQFKELQKKQDWVDFLELLEVRLFIK